MNLKKVLTVIDSTLVLVLEIANEKETFDSKSAIPEERMNFIVQYIHPANNGILIILGEPHKSSTLEELDYSFESGI